jgi:hypothetical protein
VVGLPLDDLPDKASADVDAAFGQVLTLKEVVANEAEVRHITDFDVDPTVRVAFSTVAPCRLHRGGGTRTSA